MRVNVSEGPFVYLYCTCVCSVHAHTGVHVYVRPRGMCVDYTCRYVACACGHTWHCMYVYAVYVCVMCTGTYVCHNVCTCKCVCTGECMHVSGHAGEQTQLRSQSITDFNPFPRGRRAARETQAEAPALTWGSCRSDPTAPARAGLSLSSSQRMQGAGHT